jgi:hypothetical protein
MDTHVVESGEMMMNQCFPQRNVADFILVSSIRLKMTACFSLQAGADGSLRTQYQL